MVLPDGHSAPGSDIVVLAVGPAVPKEPKMVPGTKVILRHDANHSIYGMSGKDKTGLISSDLILAVVDEQEEVPLTDAQLDAIANVPA